MIQRVSFPDQVRMSVVPAVSPSTNEELQAWFEDHQTFRFNQGRRLIEQFANGDIDAQTWYELMDAMLFEGHSNAWWIGRVWGTGEYGEISESDLLAGRAFKDAEADYLIRFTDALEAGEYLDEDGNFMMRSAVSRMRLYVGKMRGTANAGLVDSIGAEDDMYWRLGAVEEHCTECPELAEAFNPVTKDRAYTSPARGETPCLGNCECHWEIVTKAGNTIVGPRPVSLGVDDYEQAA